MQPSEWHVDGLYMVMEEQKKSTADTAGYRGIPRDTAGYRFGVKKGVPDIRDIGDIGDISDISDISVR